MSGPWLAARGSAARSALTALVLVAASACSSPERPNPSEGTTGGGAGQAPSGGSAGSGLPGGTSGSGSSGTMTGGASGTASGGAAGGGPSGSSGAGAEAGGGSGPGGGAGASAGSGGTLSGGAGGAGGKGGVGGSGSTGGAGSGGKGGGAGGSGGIAVPPGYRLVWSDEFEVDGPPSSANWSFEQGFVRNEEAQWYQPGNARVEAGVLVIEGRRERVTNPNYQSGSTDWKRSRQYAEYTSTSMHTRGKHAFQFGRFEMRGRIPTAAGTWPAFWTLGVSGEWPSNGEVDVMEFYDSRVLFNVACGTSTRYTAKWDSVSRPVADLGDPAWASKFHVWAMVWDDRKIELFLDGVLMNTSNLADMLNPDGQSPFRQQHYLLVNLAIGGMNGGNPANTQFPQRYEVDYVRVFQAE